MEWMILGSFCVLLLGCMLLDLSLLWALAAGLVIFLGYGRRRGFSWRTLAGMCMEGIRAVKSILIVFFLIGIMTALWRAAGTIPVIVCRAEKLIRPSAFLLTAFLLNCALSALTGTSFGTAATMGVICAAMGSAMGVDIRFTGGAVLSGAFFGDRCSPVSTSALLVAGLTNTNLYDNIRHMLRSALIPFLLSCAAYGLISALTAVQVETPNLEAVFGQVFTLKWIAVLPAAVILALSALRVNVKITMTASILTALPVCIWLQGMTLPTIARVAVLGFRAPSIELGRMIDGGGIVAMLRVSGIVCLSSAFSGIFQRTGLLDGMKRGIGRLSDRTTPFIATLLTAAVAGMIACNQTLTIMLTKQLCGDLTDNGSRCALDLEDTAVVVSPLVPWSIAGAVPLASVGAPLSALLAACYLYILPLWRAGVSMVKRERRDGIAPFSRSE